MFRQSRKESITFVLPKYALVSLRLGLNVWSSQQCIVLKKEMTYLFTIGLQESIYNV